MKKLILCILLLFACIFSFTFAACGPQGDDGAPVVNSELDEYNQIVNQMKDVFTQTSNQPEPMSANSIPRTTSFSSPVIFANSQESKLSDMFALMEADSTKKESTDRDYYAYGIDFSTMTAKIAGYAANNFFSVSSFYGLNILMDYGGGTVINASVTKDSDVVKTYLFTTFKNSKNEIFKEYNYTEIHFTSQTDFEILVLDYAYNPQDQLSSQAMIYASSDKEFFSLSGDTNNTSTGIVFFDRGESSSAYEIQGAKSNTLGNLFSFMSENFALSNKDKTFIGNLYNTQDYSISFSQVTQAKTDLGILIDMEDEEYVPPIGFVSNKNAPDLVGRKTLQAFVNDNKSVDGTTLTIPSEFNYLSGGIFFNANIDTLIIPSTIKGVVVYDRMWNYSILDDSLCYYEAANEYEEGRYRAWGGTLFSFVSEPNSENWMDITKPFKKYILLDDNGQPTQETDAFALDEIGNLWIKDSNGNKNYLWGFVSEPASGADTIYLPSPTFVNKDRYIQVDHFACEGFLEALRDTGKLDEYTARFKHAIIEGYVVEEYNYETGVTPGFYLLRNSFFASFEYEETGLIGCKWNLDTLTINNIINGAMVSLTDVFCSESGKLDEYGYPTGDTVCQAKVKKVILNGDFDTITFINGYCETPRPSYLPGGDGVGVIKPDGDNQILATHAISEEFQLNGRENAYFSQESVIYGEKVVEIYGHEQEFPSYPDAEILLIKSSVTELNINSSFLQIGINQMLEDRKLTIEFENIAGINFDFFDIYDLTSPYSTRVEKVKFNVSELYIENLIRNLEWNANSGWLKDIVTSGKYQVVYAEASPKEQEFLTNFTVGDFGYVSLKETSELTTFEIDDDFLSLIKKITGKELSEVELNLDNNSGNQIKIIVNVSETFFTDNTQIPIILNAGAVEIASEMKMSSRLTEVLDRITPPYENGKLIYNGTKDELIACVGESYLTRLLYLQYSAFAEINFSDETKLYKEIVDNVVTYEDERIKIVVTFIEGLPQSYYFKDKLIKNVSFTHPDGYGSGNDEENSWYVTLSCRYNSQEQSYYGDKEVIVPIYRFNIYYYYGHKEDGDFNFVYGNHEENFTIDFMVHMLPQTITLS